MSPRVDPALPQQRSDRRAQVCSARRASRCPASSAHDEVIGHAGDLIFKPRGQWHTFWNAGDEPATVLEIISPAGLEELFRSFTGLSGYPEPEVLAAMAAQYHCDLDFEATGPILERHGLSM